MNIEVVEDYGTLSDRAAAFIEARLRAAPRALYCFAAGDTPAGAYAALSSRLRAGGFDASALGVVGLDEWIGLSGEDAGSCRATLDEHLFRPLGIADDRLCFFDGKAKDLAAECARADTRVAEDGPLELVVLGLGLDGHLGFNEPGTALDARSHLVRLEVSTRDAGTKYFGGSEAPAMGITLGLGQLLSARHVLLLVSGAKKADIVRRALIGPPSLAVPASALQSRARVTVILDRGAASSLGPATT